MWPFSKKKAEPGYKHGYVGTERPDVLDAEMKILIETDSKKTEASCAVYTMAEYAHQHPDLEELISTEYRFRLKEYIESEKDNLPESMYHYCVLADSGKFKPGTHQLVVEMQTTFKEKN